MTWGISCFCWLFILSYFYFVILYSESVRVYVSSGSCNDLCKQEIFNKYIMRVLELGHTIVVHSIFRTNPGTEHVVENLVGGLEKFEFVSGESHENVFKSFNVQIRDF
jgi:hypothetical protein